MDEIAVVQGLKAEIAKILIPFRFQCLRQTRQVVTRQLRVEQF